MRTLRIVLRCAAVVTVLVGVVGRAPADVPDVFGGLPATFKLRERIVAHSRIRIPGPDRTETARSRERDTLVFESPNLFRLEPTKKNELPPSGTWTEDAQGVLTATIDPIVLQQLTDQLVRKLEKASGIRNWSAGLTAPNWQATITDAGERANGRFELDFTASKGRVEFEVSTVASWKGRRVR